MYQVQVDISNIKFGKRLFERLTNSAMIFAPVCHVNVSMYRWNRINRYAPKFCGKEDLVTWNAGFTNSLADELLVVWDPCQWLLLDGIGGTLTVSASLVANGGLVSLANAFQAKTYVPCQRGGSHSVKAK